MSYSFTVSAPDKAAAKSAVSAKLDEVMAQQPSHALDRNMAEASAHSFIDLLPGDAPAGQELSVSVNGSVGWRGTWGVDHEVCAVNFAVSCYWVVKR